MPLPKKAPPTAAQVQAAMAAINAPLPDADLTADQKAKRDAQKAAAAQGAGGEKGKGGKDAGAGSDAVYYVAGGAVFLLLLGVVIYKARQ